MWTFVQANQSLVLKAATAAVVWVGVHVNSHFKLGYSDGDVLAMAGTVAAFMWSLAEKLEAKVAPVAPVAPAVPVAPVK